jgi:hypothetical protein
MTPEQVRAQAHSQTMGYQRSVQDAVADEVVSTMTPKVTVMQLGNLALLIIIYL